MKNIIHIEESLIIYVLVIIMIIVFWRRPKEKSPTGRTRYYANPDRNFEKPQSTMAKLLAKTLVVLIAIISFTALTEYSSKLVVHEDEICFEWEKRENDRCPYSKYTSNDFRLIINGFLLTQEVDLGFAIGDELPHANSPDGPWFWIYYFIGAIVLVSGLNLASTRRRAHNKNMKQAEESMRPILRKLAFDPNGVIDGRISLPSAVRNSIPTKKEERRILVIYFFSALILITTVMSILQYFNNLQSGSHSNHMGPEHNAQAFLLMTMALGFTIASQITSNYLNTSYEGESDSIIPQNIRRQYLEAEEERRSNLSDEPASASEVLEALRKEMEEARKESEFLKEQLIETRIKVNDLESELKEKNTELESIQALSDNMEKIVSKNDDSSNKNLSLMDSVMVGDALFNGDKIDQQIFNDPKAIAKAAIEAYKEGRKDSNELELDFD